MRTSSRRRDVLATVGLLGIGLVIVGQIAPVSAGGGGCHQHRQFGPTESTGTTVDFVDFCMSTGVLRVEPGDTVTFTNRDPAPHNVVGSGMFADALAEGESAAFRFDHAGTFAYACTLHMGMVGAVVVGDGRRTAPATQPIVPVPVVPTTPETLPVRTTSPTGDAENGPVVPIALAVGLGAMVVYAVARISPWRTTNQPASSSAHERNPDAKTSSSSTVANP